MTPEERQGCPWCCSSPCGSGAPRVILVLCATQAGPRGAVSYVGFLWRCLESLEDGNPVTGGLPWREQGLCSVTSKGISLETKSELESPSPSRETTSWASQNSFYLGPFVILAKGTKRSCTG